jgi:hypothetical protein
MHLFQVLVIKFHNILTWEVKKKKTSILLRYVKIIYLGQQLTSLDEKVVGQWRMYFGLKSKFYLAEVRFL